jgi:mono/diheme cytochrome c family protein
MSRRGQAARAVALAALACAAAGCVRGCTSSRPPIHPNPDMDWQPRAEAQEASGFFYDGMAMRRPVAGTVARGRLVEDAVFVSGRASDGSFLAASPLGADSASLARGERQFTIYCQPCHDRRGTGSGILAQRGGVPTTSIHLERIVLMPDGELFDVISNGKGLMPAYGWPLEPHDRWAVVAWVRELQRREAEAAAGMGLAPATGAEPAPPPAAAPETETPPAAGAAETAAATGGAEAAS